MSIRPRRANLARKNVNTALENAGGPRKKGAATERTPLAEISGYNIELPSIENDSLEPSTQDPASVPTQQTKTLPACFDNVTLSQSSQPSTQAVAKPHLRRTKLSLRARTSQRQTSQLSDASSQNNTQPSDTENSQSLSSGDVRTHAENEKGRLSTTADDVACLLSGENSEEFAPGRPKIEEKETPSPENNTLEPVIEEGEEDLEIRPAETSTSNDPNQARQQLESGAQECASSTRFADAPTHPLEPVFSGVTIQSQLQDSKNDQPANDDNGDKAEEGERGGLTGVAQKKEDSEIEKLTPDEESPGPTLDLHTEGTNNNDGAGGVDEAVVNDDSRSNETAAHEENGEEEGPDDGATCPVCEKQLGRMRVLQRELHVNECLDRMANGGGSNVTPAPFGDTTHPSAHVQPPHPPPTCDDTLSDTPNPFPGSGNGTEDLLDMGLCMLCGKSIGGYTAQRKWQHVTRCLDEMQELQRRQEAQSAKANRRVKPKDAASAPGLRCPLCQEAFSDRARKAWTVHTRDCAQQRGIALSELVDIVRKWRISINQQTNASEDGALNENTFTFGGEAGGVGLGFGAAGRKEEGGVKKAKPGRKRGSSRSDSEASRGGTDTPSFGMITAITPDAEFSGNTRVARRPSPSFLTRQKKLDMRDHDLQMALALSASMHEGQKDQESDGEEEKPEAPRDVMSVAGALQAAMARGKFHGGKGAKKRGGVGGRKEEPLPALLMHSIEEKLQAAQIRASELLSRTDCDDDVITPTPALPPSRLQQRHAANSSPASENEAEEESEGGFLIVDNQEQNESETEQTSPVADQNSEPDMPPVKTATSVDLDQVPETPQPLVDSITTENAPECDVGPGKRRRLLDSASTPRFSKRTRLSLWELSAAASVDTSLFDAGVIPGLAAELQSSARIQPRNQTPLDAGHTQEATDPTTQPMPSQNPVDTQPMSTFQPHSNAQSTQSTQPIQTIMHRNAELHTVGVNPTVHTLHSNNTNGPCEACGACGEDVGIQLAGVCLSEVEVSYRMQYAAAQRRLRDRMTALQNYHDKLVASLEQQRTSLLARFNPQPASSQPSTQQNGHDSSQSPFRAPFPINRSPHSTNRNPGLAAATNQQPSQASTPRVFGSHCNQNMTSPHVLGPAQEDSLDEIQLTIGASDCDSIMLLDDQPNAEAAASNQTSPPTEHRHDADSQSRVPNGDGLHSSSPPAANGYLADFEPGHDDFWDFDMQEQNLEYEHEHEIGHEQPSPANTTTVYQLTNATAEPPSAHVQIDNPPIVNGNEEGRADSGLGSNYASAIGDSDRSDSADSEAHLQRLVDHDESTIGNTDAENTAIPPTTPSSIVRTSQPIASRPAVQLYTPTNHYEASLLDDGDDYLYMEGGHESPDIGLSPLPSLPSLIGQQSRAPMAVQVATPLEQRRPTPPQAPQPVVRMPPITLRPPAQPSAPIGRPAILSQPPADQQPVARPTQRPVANQNAVMPQYDVMNTPQLQAQAKKFGLKPMRKRFLIDKLKEIWTRLQETADSDSDDNHPPNPQLVQVTTVAPTQPVRAIPLAFAQIQRANQAQPLASSSQSDTNIRVNLHTAPSSQQPARGIIERKRSSSQVAGAGRGRGRGGRGGRVTVGGRNVSERGLETVDAGLLESSEEEEVQGRNGRMGMEEGEGDGGESSSAGEENDDQAPDFSDSDTEAAGGTNRGAQRKRGGAKTVKLSPSEIDVLLRSHLRVNEALYLDILQYKPLEFQSLHDTFRGAGIPVSKKHLVDFLDRQITEIPTFTGQNVDLDTLAAKDLKRLLLLKLASILQLYGCPTHRMEYNLGMAAKVLGVTASFSVLPTVTFCSFQSQTEQLAADTIIVKVQRGFDMEKLALVDALAKEYKSMEQPYELTEAIIVLDDIISRPSGPPIWLRVLLMGLTSSSIASLFFHGSWVDFGISFVLGAMVGVMEWVAGWSSRFSKVFEICASVFGAFMGQALCTVIPTLCPSAISISSIIWLVPGMDMALATTELTVRNTVSGTTRMFQALYLSTLLGFGLTFGHKLVLWAPDTPEVTSQQCTSPVAPVFTYILVPVAAISLSLLLKATVRQCCVIVPIAIMGFVVNTYASKVFDGQTAAACSSFAVGLLGNVYSNISQTPAVIPILSGILLLVPGSLGLKGAAAFLKKDVMGGMQFSMDLITTSLCITLGLFAASMFVVPRKNTKSIVNMKF